MNLMEKYLRKLESPEFAGMSKANFLSQEVFQPGTFQDYQSLFEKAVAEVGAVYLPGTLELIREDFPDLCRETEEAEDRVNELWLKARTEAVDIENFKEAVGQWKTIHLRATRFFSLSEGCQGHTVKPG